MGKQGELDGGEGRSHGQKKNPSQKSLNLNPRWSGGKGKGEHEDFKEGENGGIWRETETRMEAKPRPAGTIFSHSGSGGGQRTTRLTKSEGGRYGRKLERFSGEKQKYHVGLRSKLRRKGEVGFKDDQSGLNHKKRSGSLPI